MHLYHCVFQQFNISLESYARLLQRATFSTGGKGDVIVREGQRLDRVLLIYDGSADAMDESDGTMYSYHGSQGSVIGGEALVSKPAEVSTRILGRRMRL